jgi:hypothetical protein
MGFELFHYDLYCLFDYIVHAEFMNDDTTYNSFSISKDISVNEISIRMKITIAYWIDILLIGSRSFFCFLKSLDDENISYSRW